MADSEYKLSNTCDVAIKDEPCVIKPESIEAEDSCIGAEESMVPKDVLLAENEVWDHDCKMLDFYDIDIKDEPLASISQNLESKEQFTDSPVPDDVDTTNRLTVPMYSHNGEKPYACNQCNKCFNLKSNLVKHIRIHTGEKPYTCNQCAKCFTEKSNLVNHIRVHTGVKPYSCNRCEKCFTKKSNLVKHIRIHTGEKPYLCQQCKKCFNVKCNLEKHIRTHWRKTIHMQSM